mmetsp:Transcript_33335/g.49690  ORF Transcript_33335/g.49690 Transcript_33335/m.49690 type:complete len:473 (-) Transcript_33335:18-1436(-)
MSPFLIILLLALIQLGTSFSALRTSSVVSEPNTAAATTLKKDLKTFLLERQNNQKNASHQPREYCSKCNRPFIQCLCNRLPSQKIKVKTEVRILQHPVEFRRKTVSTVPLIKLVLEKCNVMVGRSFGSELEAVVDDACQRGLVPLLLFPANDAITLENKDAIQQLQAAKQRFLSQEKIAPNTGNCNEDEYLLIIVDGTWTQAKRMVRNSPILFERCQPVQFMSTSDRSIYDSIRKQPESFCLSTLESCARTLKLLEPNNPDMESAVGHLHASLRGLVNTQMKKERESLEENPDSIRNSTKLEMKRMRQLDIIMKDVEQTSTTPRVVGLKNVIDIGNGYRLRSLNGTQDAKYVDSIWPYSSSKSLKMIERQIDADNRNSTITGYSCCLGVEYDKQLVGCIIRHRNGSLGILHVDNDHRRKGLGAILVEVASRAIMQRNEKLFAYVVDGNNESMNFFSKLGWVKSDPAGKRGTG